MTAMQWNRLLTRSRLGAKERPIDPAKRERPDFRRDADKIVFSAAWRRLNGKTQVHLQGGDVARNRLTHSHEVSRVGHSIGTIVGHALAERGLLPDVLADGDRGFMPHEIGDVVEAASLAHDIGTVPFGHGGESTIQDWFRTSPIGRELIEPLNENQRADFLRFEGNAVGFRLLTRGDDGSVEGGLHLTKTAIAAVVKYPGPSALSSGSGAANAGARKYNWFDADRASWSDIAAKLGIIERGDGTWVRHPLVFLTEAADDICYQIVDLEDAHRVGHLDHETVISLYLKVLESAASIRPSQIAEATRRSGDSQLEREEVIAKLRAICISELIEQAAARFMDNHDAILDGTYDHELPDDLPATPAIDAIRAVSRERIYDHPERMRHLVRGHDALVCVLNSIGHAVAEIGRTGGMKGLTTRSRYVIKAFPGIVRPEDDAYARILRMTDAVAAMTDDQALHAANVFGGSPLTMPPLDAATRPWNEDYHV
jgi:dGTPase